MFTHDPNKANDGRRNEIDIELSRWGVVNSDFNAQYKVWTIKIPTQTRLMLRDEHFGRWRHNAHVSIGRTTRSRSKVTMEYNALIGTCQGTMRTYWIRMIFPSVGPEQVHLNLWLYGGFPWIPNAYDPNATSMEVVFTSFDFVPEPATMALLALGGLAILRRRKQ